MMDERPGLGEVLQGFMDRVGVGQERLARLSGVREETLHHWLDDGVRRPYIVGNLLKVAAALDLSRVQADHLLTSAGWPTIEKLAASPDEENGSLVSRWTTDVRNNLPADLTSFVGREYDVVDIGGLLSLQHVRLVTLTGAGGSGKTRLAIHVARNLFDLFPDGVVFVPLESITESELAIVEIARTMGMQNVAPDTARRRMIEVLQQRKLLLVLDNLEQVADLGSDLAHVLRGTTHAKILATSRVPLHVTGEHEWRVLPFTLPRPDLKKADLERNPAIQLYVDRARAADAQFRFTRNNMAAIASLCAGLDGLPLAIELAASHGRRTDPDELLQRFGSHLDLASHGPHDAPLRQQHLRETIAWSVDLLSNTESTLFAKLSVFAGGWTMNDAQTLFSSSNPQRGEVLSGMHALHRASLVEQDSVNGSIRYRMLETIKEFAGEQLEGSGQLEDLRRCHAEHFLHNNRPAHTYVTGSRPDDWYTCIDADLDNVRAALAWSQAHDEPAVFAENVAGIGAYWYEFNRSAEGLTWATRAQAHADVLPQDVLARLHTAAFIYHTSLSEFAGAGPYAESALSAWESLLDAPGQATIRHHLGWTAFTIGDVATALEHFSAHLALWREIDDPRGIIIALTNFSLPLLATGNVAAAMQGLNEVAQLVADPRLSAADRDLGHARVQSDRGVITLLAGDPVSAIALLSDAVRRTQAMPNSHLLPAALFYLGVAECLIGDLDASEHHLSESLAIRERGGETYNCALVLLGFAALTHRRGQAERSAELCGAVQAIVTSIGAALPPPAQALYEQEIGLVKTHLTDADFDAHFARGTGLLLAEAIALATTPAPNV